MNNLLNGGQPFDLVMAQELGLNRRSLAVLTHESRLRRLFRGVYVDAASPDTRPQRLAGIRLIAPPEAIVCNESAAWLLGVDTFKPSEQYLLEPSLVVPHGSTRVTKPGIKCRQAIIASRDITSIDGVLTTTPVRTTSDLLRRLYRPYALAAADGMAHAGLVIPDEMWEFVAKLKGYPGIVQARNLAVLIEPLADSAGESWMRLRIIDAGFPVPRAQFAIVDNFGRQRWADLAYPHLKIASEYDGREFHTDDQDVEHDQGRRGYLANVLG
ncbi:MAG: hypothetical protein M3Q98_13095, partial [Actinomycetota bacterium]|nr:hypothetical protein [Actinomycetota bacterium]